MSSEIELTAAMGPVATIAFLLVTGAIAVIGLGFRKGTEKPDTIRLLFGSIAAVFFVLVLLQGVFGFATSG